MARRDGTVGEQSRTHPRKTLTLPVDAIAMLAEIATRRGLPESTTIAQLIREEKKRLERKSK